MLLFSAKFEEKTLEINPEYVPALNNKAAAFRDLGNYDESIKIYDQVLEIDSQNKDAIEGKEKTIDKRLGESVGSFEQSLQGIDQIVTSVHFLLGVAIVGVILSFLFWFKPRRLQI